MDTIPRRAVAVIQYGCDAQVVREREPQLGEHIPVHDDRLSIVLVNGDSTAPLTTTRTAGQTHLAALSP